MKKIMIIAALIGFNAIGSYAQDTKACACAKKVVHHTVKHHTAAPAVAMAKKPVHHKKATGCPVAMNYKSDRSYTGNYPANRPQKESNYFVYPMAKPAVVVPSTDPDYYLKQDDGACRWSCSPGVEQEDRNKK